MSFDQNKTAKQQFLVRVTQAEDLERAIAERAPKNTKNSTIWGSSVFQYWYDKRGINRSVLELSEINSTRELLVLSMRLSKQMATHSSNYKCRSPPSLLGSFNATGNANITINFNINKLAFVLLQC